MATHEIPARFRRLAWYAPTFVVVFAGIRALGLGLRQPQISLWLKQTESVALGTQAHMGWAVFFREQPSVVATTAGVFYLLLTILTATIAYRTTLKTSE